MMKQLTVMASLFFSLMLWVPGGGAQESKPSLADVARKARQRKGEQAAKPKVLTNDEVAGKTAKSDTPSKALAEINLDNLGSTARDEKKGTPPSARAEAAEKKEFPNRELYGNERRALSTLVTFAVAEEHCHSVQGYYLTLDQLLRIGCVGTGGNVDYVKRKGFDPDHDPDYHYSAELSGESCRIHADPVKGSLTGFYLDGDDFYFNPRGTATANDRPLPIEQVEELLR